MLEYVHFVPGRLRFKNTTLRSRHRAAEAELDIGEIPEVLSVVANPPTGSVTINFDEQRLSIGRLWERLGALGYVSGPCPSPSTAASASTIDPGGTRFGETVMTAVLEAVIRQSAEVLVRALL